MILKKTAFILFSIVILVASCQQNELSTSSTTSVQPKQLISKSEALILNKHFFENLPSGSGIEAASASEQNYFIVGDDSPYLYQLNADYTLVNQHLLFPDSNFATGRIPSAIKPDLECMGKFTYRGRDYLLLLGSGATTARNRGFIVNLDKAYEVKELDLNTFYTFLKQVVNWNQKERLNLEGLAFDEKHVYLFQRGLNTSANILVRFDAAKFIRHVMEAQPLPPASVFYFNLPKLSQFQAGFSGAYVFHNYLFFTASVESAPNAIVDGEILGSYVGYVSLEDLDLAANPAKPLSINAVPLKYKDGTSYKGKAESLVVNHVDKQWNYNLVLVSDDDLGHSELLEVQFKLK